MGKKVRNADHVRRMNVPGPDNTEVKARLERLLSPAVYSPTAYFQSLGLRARILSLPLMVAALLTLLWQQIPGVSELTRVLNRDGALWFGPVRVSQTAISKRLQSLPYEVLRQVFMALLPVLQARWQGRQRPLPESLVTARRQFAQVLCRGRVEFGGAVSEIGRIGGCPARAVGRQNRHGR